MNKRFLIAGATVLGTLFAFAVTIGETSPKLKAYAEAMAAAPSFTAKYSVQVIGASASEYSVAFSKPNMARIETEESITVADGKTIYVFNKADNTFIKKSQTEAELLGLFSNMETSFWKPFFKPDCVNNYSVSKDAGTKTRGGKTLNVVNVQADAKGETTMKLYTDTTDNTLRQGEITTNGAKGSESTVVIVSESSMTAASDLFAFKAPAGSKEVEASLTKPGEFTTDFWAALALAKSTGKLLMVDFMASWCGPCKMMDKEVFHGDKFKEMSKDFILVKVDVDVQKDVAQKYGITAMPTVKFIRGDGSVAHEFVGYGGPDQVFGEIATAKGKK